MQRIGSMDPKEGKAADRVGIFQMCVERVVTDIKPSFFVLAEVTSCGPEIVTWLQKANRNAQGYAAEFVPVNHAKNPCNDLVIKKNRDTVRYLGLTGSDVQRPYVTMDPSNGIRVAFAHLKSGGSDKTGEALMTLPLGPLGRGARALRRPEPRLPRQFLARRQSRQGSGQGRRQDPRPAHRHLPATYQKESWSKRTGAFRHTAKTLEVLVYANSLSGRVKHLPVDYDKEFHALIDHAPIAFQIASG